MILILARTSGERIASWDDENLLFAGGKPAEDDRTVVVATFRGK